MCPYFVVCYRSHFKLMRVADDSSTNFYGTGNVYFDASMFTLLTYRLQVSSPGKSGALIAGLLKRDFLRQATHWRLVIF